MNELLNYSNKISSTTFAPYGYTIQDINFLPNTYRPPFVQYHQWTTSILYESKNLNNL
jgi:hypothetical protein